MKKKFLTVAAACLVPLCGFSQNLILNGSFENGTAPNETFGFPNDVLVVYPAVPGVNLTVDDWTLSLGAGWGEFYWYWGSVLNLPSQDGSRFINLSSAVGQATTESISQSFNVSAGNEYTVSYYERERRAGATMTAQIQLAAGSAAGTLSQLANAGATWTQFSFSFTPDTTTTATLSFFQTPGTTLASDDGVLLDNVLVIVPEPSTVALLGLGGLVLALRRRR
jgi:hypothetical protein